MMYTYVEHAQVLISIHTAHTATSHTAYIILDVIIVLASRLISSPAPKDVIDGKGFPLTSAAAAAAAARWLS